MKIDKLNILIIFMSIMKLSKFTLLIFILFFPLLGTSYDISNLPESKELIKKYSIKLEEMRNYVNKNPFQNQSN